MFTSCRAAGRGAARAGRVPRRRDRARSALRLAERARAPRAACLGVPSRCCGSSKSGSISSGSDVTIAESVSRGGEERDEPGHELGSVGEQHVVEGARAEALHEAFEVAESRGRDRPSRRSPSRSATASASSSLRFSGTASSRGAARANRSRMRSSPSSAKSASKWLAHSRGVVGEIRVEPRDGSVLSRVERPRDAVHAHAPTACGSHVRLALPLHLQPVLESAQEVVGVEQFVAGLGGAARRPGRSRAARPARSARGSAGCDRRAAAAAPARRTRRRGCRRVRSSRGSARRRWHAPPRPAASSRGSHRRRAGRPTTGRSSDRSGARRCHPKARSPATGRAFMNAAFSQVAAQPS